MRAIKSFFVFALPLCLTEPYLVAAQLGNNACNGRVRFTVVSFLCSHIRAEIVLNTLIIFSSYLKLSSLSSAVSFHKYFNEFDMPTGS